MQRADLTVFEGGSKILAAISSGGDSVALFRWLHAQSFDFCVAHIHHDLHELRRGDCDTDENFVRELSARFGVAYATRRLNLPRKDGHVNELVAREARYAALLEMAHEVGATCVATAHTSDDLLEGAILNLMRGAGLGGWTGFAPLRDLGKNVRLARPFWNVTRAQLRDFLVDLGQEWREDESNQASEFARNRVRNEVLPLLSAISGRETSVLASGFAQNADVARAENEFMASAAREALEAVRIQAAKRVTSSDINDSNSLEKGASRILILDGTKFSFLALALQRRVLRLAVLEVAPDARDISFRKIEALRVACVQNQKRQVWCWRSDLRAEWTGSACGNRIRLWRVG